MLGLKWRRGVVGAALALMAGASCAFAEGARFDLLGPTLEVSVTHAGHTLPIAETPNLQAGDQISIKADFPPGDAVRYILVSAFLRGAANPPPESWFKKADLGPSTDAMA